ncbi:MAG: flavodoxin [Firmicutes bacterium HGW-Firmicutes-16]|nr:MAG: flavodoxin [Firmicutes bacterium HGW-Firmicutes-16]
MKTLVAFYSLEGYTELVAGVIATKLGADILKLETVKPFPTKGFAKFFIGGMSSVCKATPKLKNTSIDLSSYDNIVLGTPVWASTFASPINTLLQKHKFAGKKVALLVCSGGPDVEKCLVNFRKALVGNEIVGDINFTEPQKQDKEEVTKRATAWAESLKF